MASPPSATAPGLLFTPAHAGQAPSASDLFRLQKGVGQWAPVHSPEADTTDEGLGIGGFVLNETFSVVGDNFYSAFYNAWSEPDDASLYTLHVREEPTPQFGARVVVEVGDAVVFRTFLRPNLLRTRRAAEQAAQRAQLYIREYHQPRQIY